MRTFNRAYAKIHLDRIRENMEAMKQKLDPGTKMIGVVKADGYGHGAYPVAKTIDPYVTSYAVASFEEALHLKQRGVVKDVLILGVTPRNLYRHAIEEEISMTIFKLEWAKELSELAQEIGKTAKIHIAVDTGMSRIGFMPTEKAADIVKEMASLPGIKVEGMFTHFARADEADKTSAKRQLELFQQFCGMVKARGVEIPLIHCSNSAAIMEFEEAHMDAVRAGIIIYGLYPSNEVDRTKLAIKPAMELKSFVTYVKEIEPGDAVSYGGTFVAEKKMTIGTVGIGYADGYPRNASGKGQVLVCGKRVPILGRVCMDQMMIDLSEVPEAFEGAEVTLIGWDGDEEITMEELAEISDGFHYEIPTIIGKRIPRMFLSDGQVVGTLTYDEYVYERF